MEKLEHLALMLNKRTKGKKYENFVVNSIYTKISNPDLIPITQQYVKNPNYSDTNRKKYCNYSPQKIFRKLTLPTV